MTYLCKPGLFLCAYSTASGGNGKSTGLLSRLTVKGVTKEFTNLSDRYLCVIYAFISRGF